MIIKAMIIKASYGIKGWYCKKCKCKLWYDDKYDAMYCPWCIEWRESGCKDQDCEYCQDRPTYPYPDIEHAIR